MNQQVFIFDVDGVIVDSTEECLLVCYNAWLAFTANPRQPVTNISDIPADFDIAFRTIRKYVRSMDEYYCISNPGCTQVSSQQDFERILRSLDKPLQAAFGIEFFAHREKLKQDNMSYWYQLHTVYPGIKEFINQIYRNFDVYVVTGKDKQSVVDLFQYLDIPIDERVIYDKNAAKNKLLCIDKIREITHLSPSDILFLDDNITHLEGPSNAGYQVMLANWGYVTDEHLVMADKLDIKSFSLGALNLKFGTSA